MLIPEENMVWCPESLMETILAQVHYLPAEWKGKAHTSEVFLLIQFQSNSMTKEEFLFQVRQGISELFQFKAVYLLEELISPIVTPFILYFWLRPKAQEIVDFLRQFTVEVVGVGDVCSFAQLDLNKHGQPQLYTSVITETSSGGHSFQSPSVSRHQQFEEVDFYYIYFLKFEFGTIL